MHRRALLISSITAVGVLAAAHDANAASIDPDLSEAFGLAVKSYAGAWGVSESDARRGLEAQAAGADIVGIAKQALGGDVALVEWDPVAVAYVVRVGEGVDVTPLNAALAQAKLSNFRIERSTWTGTQAAAETKRLAANLRASGTHNFSIATDADGIEMTVERDAPLPAARELNGGVTPQVPVRLTRDDAALSRSPAACNSDFCDAPLIGGVHWSRPTPNQPGYVSSCTTAFAARSKDSSNNRQYMLTAGHCVYGDGAVAVTCSTTTCNNGLFGNDIGGRYQNGGTDAGVLEVNQAPWPVYPAYRTFASPSQTLAVRGQEGSALRATYCHTGYRTGTSCGQVKQQNETYPYAPSGAYGPTSIEGLTRVENVNGGGGDSGGPWFDPANGFAVGIHSGFGGDPFVGEHLFQEIAKSEQVTGTVILTTG